MISVRLVSADPALHSLLCSALRNEFELSISAYRTKFEPSSDQVVLLDLDSSQPGIQQQIFWFKELVEASPAVVVLADDILRSTATELVREGAFGYCRRPPSLRDLKLMLTRAHEHGSMKNELRTVQEQFRPQLTCDQLIGSSPQMQQVYDLIGRVADISASVLITGESGTGKELIARAVHNTGSRAGRPFIAVSCGAIPETLIEAELFGHEKGAFTGTTGQRIGLFEQAEDGTLLLDEIGELSPAIQVKLLRVLQQREFNRLGSNRLLPLRARVLFATHRDLAEMVAQGTFRQDLFYRINVVRIEAPSLQDHAEDILPLARHFLQHYSTIYEKPMVGIDASASLVLETYAWPGNVRELENAIQRAIVLAHGKMVRAEDLPRDIQDQNVVSMDEYHPAGSFERQLRTYKIKLAMDAVRENGGNKTEAARELQISRAYLHRLIRLADPLPQTEELVAIANQNIGNA